MLSVIFFNHSLLVIFTDSLIGVGKRVQVYGLTRGGRGPHGLRTNFFKRSMFMLYFWVRTA